jgi:hypothetical protein
MTGLAGEGLDEHARLNYVEHCLGVLNNPERLWQRAFDTGLDEADRVLLLCMASLPDGVTLAALEAAFVAACEARGIPAHGRRFAASLKVLDDSFVSTQRQRGTTIVVPHNPSLLDFLMLAGSKYIEQVLWTWRVLSRYEQGRPSRRSPPPAELMQAFSRAFEATLDSPTLDTGQRPDEMLTAMRLASPAGRLELLLEHFDQAGSLAADVMRDWFARYASDWADGPLADDPSVEGLELVRRLARHGALDAEAIAVRLKPKLMAMPVRITRWQCVAEAHDLAPEAFGEQEWQAIQAEVSEALEDILDDAVSYFDQVSEVEDFAGAAELMGIEIDHGSVDAAIEDLEISIAERDYEDDREYEPDYDPDDFRDLRGGGQDDSDIDAMFSRLAD